MKKVIFIVSILFIAGACTDLDETLYDQIESVDYGKTADEVETIVGKGYASLRGFNDGISISYPTCEYVLFLTECSSDEACIPTRGADWYDGGRYQEAQYHTWTPTNSMILSAWRYCYEGISKVNSVIYQVNLSNLTDDEKANINVELGGLRAYYYYLLLDMFGNVPIVTDYEETELPANSTRIEVFEFVESELKDIMDKLPDTIIYGKFTQNVANALLARLYLNAEVFTGEPRWQDCIDACDQITGYMLEPDFFTNFLINNEVSKENIFTIPYDSKAGTKGNYLQSMTFHEYQKYAISLTGNYPGSPNGICAQPGIYSSFEDNDLRKNSFIEGPQISLSTGEVIIMDTGQPLNYTEEIHDFTNAYQNEGVRMYKYEVKEGESWERDHDWVLMRYSEILLMKAECYVRLGLPDKARPFIASVRSRAGLETSEIVDLDLINDELEHEFAFEGHRRTDNIRLGDFFEPWWNKGVTPSYRGIYPIPQSVLDKNRNLVQNSGY